MQEHLIPQDISNYKFHLIGELDLKQFGEIMAGVIVAVIIYRMNWPDLIKWPLMLISAGFGIFAAFIPLGGRPLSKWITVFFKALFAPTKFYWHKQTVIPSYFTYELPARNREFLDANSTFNDSPAKKHKALAYFSTLGVNVATGDDPLEIFNDQKIAQATADFQTAPAPEPQAVVAPQKVTIKRDVTADHSTRQRQIITPTQASLDSFLQTSSIFQPIQVTEQITAVDARLAAADSNLAALTNETTNEQQVAATDSSLYSTATTPTNPPQPPLVSSETTTQNTTYDPNVVLPSLDANTATTTVASVTNFAPADSVSTTPPTTPTATITTPAPTTSSPSATSETTTPEKVNGVILPNLELPGTPILSPTPNPTDFATTAPAPPLITPQ